MVQCAILSLLALLPCTAPGGAVPTGPPPYAAVGDRPIDRMERPAPAAGDTVVAGFGAITLGGLLQVWYVNGTDDEIQTFRIRRARLRFTGTLHPRVRWRIMVDAARLLDLGVDRAIVADTTVVADTAVVDDVAIVQASRVLQDAYLTAEFGGSFHLDIGQRKIPLSLEALQSSASLKTIERALFLSGRGGDLGDVRDIGVMAYGAITKRVDYQIGVFNGLGEEQNAIDLNDAMAVVGRVVVRPAFLRGLQVGGSGGWNGGEAREEELSRPFAPRNRLGAELLFERGRFTLQSEVMGGRDADTSRIGSYGFVAYRFTPRIEGVVRLDYWDPDRSRGGAPATAAEWDYLLGVNYYIRGDHLKLQANVVGRTFSEGGPSDRGVLLLNMQGAW